MMKIRKANLVARERSRLFVSIGCLFALMAILIRPAFADPPMRIVYFEDYAPYSYKLGSTTKGLLIDIVDEIVGNKMGVEVVHESYPWARAQRMVEAGDADAFITSLNNHRLSYTHATGDPVLRTNISIWISKQGPNYDAIQSITSIQELSKYTVCEYIGYGLSNFVPAKRKIRIRNLEIALIHLASGRCDAIVDDSLVIRHNVEKLGLEPFIEELQIPVFSNHFHLMISKKSPFADLLPHFNTELKNWVDSSEFREMKSRYHNNIELR